MEILLLCTNFKQLLYHTYSFKLKPDLEFNLLLYLYIINKAYVSLRYFEKAFN